MQDYLCPVCGTLIGTAIVGSRPTFYHCGVSFPEVEKFDWRTFAGDISIPLGEREAKMARYVRAQDGELNHLEKECRVDLYAARNTLKNIRGQRDVLVTFEAPGTSKVTFSNTAKTKLITTHFLCTAHANAQGITPPELNLDACKEYDAHHNLGYFK